VIWSREEDIRHDVYRPVYRDVISASLKDGKINSWAYRVTGSAVMARWFPPAYQKEIDIDGVDSAVDIPYGIPNLRVEFGGRSRASSPPASGAASAPTTMSSRSRALSTSSPIRRARIRSISASPCWTRPAPQSRGAAGRAEIRLGREAAGADRARHFGPGRLRQLHLHGRRGEVDNSGEVKLRRIVSAVDTGIPVNPDTIIAQLQGGLISA